MKLCAILAWLAVSFAQESPLIPEQDFVKPDKYPFLYPNQPRTGEKYNPFNFPPRYGPEYQSFLEAGSKSLNYPTTFTTTGILRTGIPSTFTCKPHEAVASWDSFGSVSVLRCTPLLEPHIFDKFGVDVNRCRCRWTDLVPVSTGIPFSGSQNCQSDEYLAGITQTIREGEPYIQLQCCQKPNFEVVPETCYTSIPEVKDTRLPEATAFGGPFPSPLETSEISGGARGRVHVPSGRELVHAVQINPSYESVVEYCVYVVKGQRETQLNGQNFYNTPYTSQLFGGPYNTPFANPNVFNPIPLPSQYEIRNPYGLPNYINFPYSLNTAPYGIPTPFNQVSPVYGIRTIPYGSQYGPIPQPYGVPTGYDRPFTP